jgi:hypothetical protein
MHSLVVWRDLPSLLTVVNYWAGDIREVISMQQHALRARTDLNSYRGILHSVIVEDDVFDQGNAITGC